MARAPSIVVLSREPWDDDAFRRNQLLVSALLAGRPGVRVLFVEPPTPVLHDLGALRAPTPALRGCDDIAGLTILRPVAWRADRLSAYLSPRYGRSIRAAARGLGFDRPVLWVNDPALAPFAVRTGWPVLYDATGDWPRADQRASQRRRASLDDGMLMRGADAVVVSSQSLAASRGARRDVVVVPSGVDAEHFARPQPRPRDLGEPPVAVHAGVLHDDRFDVALSCAVADELPEVTFTHVGPVWLRPDSRAELESRSNIRLLGPRPYSVLPAYLQHANAVVVPHVVSSFTESLDPINANQCLATGTPTVATPVAGFRDLGPPVRVAEPSRFSGAVAAALEDVRVNPAGDLWSWADAADAFGKVIDSLGRFGRPSGRYIGYARHA